MNSSSISSVTPDSPWLGLRSFAESDTAHFFGRELELEDLRERVVHKPLTVLFGQSGWGKTSLLQAGLIPGCEKMASSLLLFGWFMMTGQTHSKDR